MPRRGDPECIYQAQRYGVFMRLTQNERLDQLDAEHWISRWEREAEATGQHEGRRASGMPHGGGSRRTVSEGDGGSAG